MEAEPVVECDIGVGEFIQFDPDTGAPSRGDGLKAVGDRFGEGLCIDEYDAAEEPVLRDPIAIFRFQVEHVLPRNLPPM